MTLPVGTVGKAGAVQDLKGNNLQDLKGNNKDLKVNDAGNRIVEPPVTPKRSEVREAPVLKLNNNPPQGNRFQGNAFSGKINGGLGGNSGPRFAQSMGGFGHRMH